MAFKEPSHRLVACKKVYTCHKFQVFNDQFHWPKILATCDQIGEIYHMGFSDNLSQQYKYEPQFSKQQYSLHCAVKHTGCKNSTREYFYHLTDDMKHNVSSTALVIYHFLTAHQLFASNLLTAQHNTRANMFPRNGRH